MNNSESAKKGFRTFVLTLSVSLVVFSVIYYALTSVPQPTDQTEQASTNVESAKNLAANEKKEVKGISVVAADTTPSAEPAANTQAQPSSAFSDLAVKKLNSEKAVLAATSTNTTTTKTTTQTTKSVPVTGSTEITFSLLISLAFFLSGVAWVLLNPRKQALKAFEQSVYKNS
jgi:hypothetical protein